MVQILLFVLIHSHDFQFFEHLQYVVLDLRYVGSDAILMCETKCMIFENVYVNVQDMMVECWCCPAENQSFLAGPDSYNNIARD